MKKAKEGQRDEKTVVAGEMKEEVERLYKLRMPDDFFHFWEFCKSLRADCPQGTCAILMVLYLYQHFSCMFLHYYLALLKNKDSKRVFCSNAIKEPFLLSQRTF